MKRSILFVVILFLTACSRSPEDKQSLIFPQRNHLLTAKSPGVASDPSNPENPYDHVGITHNKIIWALLDQVHKTGDTSRRFRRSFVITFGRKLHGIIADKAIESVEKKLSSCNYDLDTLLRTGNLTPDCRRDIIYLSDILQKIKTGATYESIRKEIIDLEARVANRPYPEQDKRVFFIAASVARHSAYIWNPITAMPQRFFLINWGVAVMEFFANAHTDFLAAIGGALMGLSIDEIDIMTAEESEGAVNFIDGYWG